MRGKKRYPDLCLSSLATQNPRPLLPKLIFDNINMLYEHGRFTPLLAVFIFLRAAHVCGRAPLARSCGGEFDGVLLVLVFASLFCCFIVDFLFSNAVRPRCFGQRIRVESG